MNEEVGEGGSLEAKRGGVEKKGKEGKEILLCVYICVLCGLMGVDFGCFFLVGRRANCYVELMGRGKNMALGGFFLLL